MKSHHRTFVAIACVFIHSFDDDDDDDDDDDEMMTTRRVTLLRTVRDRSFAISCVISFVRDLDARDARDVDARRTFTRMDGWMGG